MMRKKKRKVESRRPTPKRPKARRAAPRKVANKGPKTRARLDASRSSEPKTVLTAPVPTNGVSGSVVVGPATAHVDTETGVRTPLLPPVEEKKRKRLLRRPGFLDPILEKMPNRQVGELAHVLDVDRKSIYNWQKAGPNSVNDWNRVRLKEVAKFYGLPDPFAEATT